MTQQQAQSPSECQSTKEQYLQQREGKDNVFALFLSAAVTFLANPLVPVPYWICQNLSPTLAGPGSGVAIWRPKAAKGQFLHHGPGKDNVFALIMSTAANPVVPVHTIWPRTMSLASFECRSVFSGQPSTSTLCWLCRDDFPTVAVPCSGWMAVKSGARPVFERTGAQTLSGSASPSATAT
jgi:hypothetical protein